MVVIKVISVIARWGEETGATLKFTRYVHSINPENCQWIEEIAGRATFVNEVYQVLQSVCNRYIHWHCIFYRLFSYLIKLRDLRFLLHYLLRLKFKIPVLLLWGHDSTNGCIIVHYNVCIPNNYFSCLKKLLIAGWLHIISLIVIINIKRINELL